MQSRTTAEKKRNSKKIETVSEQKKERFTAYKIQVDIIPGWGNSKP